MSESVEPCLRLVSWNMAGASPVATKASWDDVRDQDVDVALVQEAPDPWGCDDLEVVPPMGSFWGIEGTRSTARAAIARVSDRVTVVELPTAPLTTAGYGELGVSRLGTVTVATATVVATGEQLLVVSVYGQWEKPLPWNDHILADASMHRVLSDLEPLLVYRELPVLVAGDFNSVLGSATVHGGADWVSLNDSVFTRFEALGLHLAGPQLPHGVPAENPEATFEGNANVPTFRTKAGNMVSQLDYVYVTDDLVERTRVRARNEWPDDWGPSDHCRVVIDIAPPG